MDNDAYMWALMGELKLVGGVFKREGHEYQIETIRDKSPRQCARKATQLVFTMAYIIKVLHGMIHGLYPVGFYYMFPTGDKVSDFSDSRFRPLIDENPGLIGKHVLSTDKTTLKKIGGSYLYFKGGRLGQTLKGETKKLHGVKGDPCDGVCFDEVDEIDQAIINPTLERMAHSEVKHEFYLGNPTIPDYGIDKIYQNSDQRIWMLKCDHCGKDSCLELEFPGCLQRQSDRSVKRICVKCGKEINIDNGRWIAQYPDKSEEMVGRWISHLNSRFVDPKALLDKWESPDLDKKTFYNMNMGLPYLEAENELTEEDVLSCCDFNYIMPMSHPGVCAAGIDVQGERKGFHIVIGCRVNNETVRIVKVARIRDIVDVVDLLKKFNVKSAVYDMYPETRLVKQVAKNSGYEVFLCEYKDSQRKAPAFDSKEYLVSMNRTEACDATHDAFKPSAFGVNKIIIPRKNSEIEEYAKQMSKPAKTFKEDEYGGREYTYIKRGQDDYYHATNYFLLALMRVGVSRSEDRKNRNTGKDKWGDWSIIEYGKAGGWMGT